MSDRENEWDATAYIESTTKEEVDGFHRYLKRQGQGTCAIDLPQLYSDCASSASRPWPVHLGDPEAVDYDLP
jgi:hypothetical protein